jgi:cellulose synthase/poly-beta-1,6-N-acetylglucosamine synthase-like glycosyltransferase
MRFILSIALFSLFFEASASTLSLKTQEIKGYLVDFKTRSGVDKVQVELISLKSGKRFTTESNDGMFMFKHVPIGKNLLLLTDKDYLSDTLAIFETNSKEHLIHYTFSEDEPFAARLKVTWFFNWGDRTVTLSNGKTYVKEHYWSHLLAKIILVVYGFCLIMIFYYSVVQLSLAINYRRSKKKGVAPTPSFDPASAPKVTVQLPMYNEMYVAERIIETTSKFNYPKDRLQIQVLDDSTDETKDIIARKVAEITAQGVNIQHVHRVDRTGYKAGALDAAMDQVEGEFIAIFDADFVPDQDFLIRTIPHFNHENIGVVQTRWGHLNKSYSVLTELQAFGLNGHFAIEQQGRNASGHFINFNGTAGIWRKSCIEDAGGWEHDTITEDLDLSYRAQMKGWKFTYLEDVESPAELPITMSALKSQQHRWMKGGAEVFIKIRRRLIAQKGLRFSDRIHGLAHLFNSSVFVFILILSLLSLAILHIKDSFSDLNFFVQFGAFFISSTVFLAFYYWNSYRDKKGHFFSDLGRFTFRFFQFLSVSMALSLSNAVAVIEGYLRIKSSFVRTPKFNVSKKDEFSGNHYDKKSLSIVNIAEGILMSVFAFTAINRLIFGDFGMVPFHGMLAIGYGVIFFSTLKEVRQGK